VASFLFERAVPVLLSLEKLCPLRRRARE